jgi:hypothetical protein
MHEKMLMLLVFLYITASFRQEKVILRLTSRLITIKIGPSFLVLCQRPVVHWVAPCAYHLRAAVCVIGHVPFIALHFRLRRAPLLQTGKVKPGPPKDGGPRSASWRLHTAYFQVPGHGHEHAIAR